MSKREMVLLFSRALAVLFAVDAFVAITYLPERLNSFLHYAGAGDVVKYGDYASGQYTLYLVFSLVRISVYVIVGVLFWRCGPKTAQLLFPDVNE